ncbi:MAG TPA: PAS domain S-box protein [Syntrophorhabdales bacterium]|nr:PAS domain S-box protein [Syntrophorhabdales bacterium]
MTVQKRPGAAQRGGKVSFGPHVERVPTPVFVVDQEGCIVHSNCAAAELSGYDRPRLQGMHIWDLHLAEERDEVLRAAALLHDEGQVDLEARLRRQDGRIIWVSMRMVRIENNLSLAYYLDVTDRKLAEEVLKESEEKCRLLFEKSVHPIFLVDRDGFVDCNEAALRLMRCSRKEELVGLGPLDVSPERQPDGRLSSEKQRELDRITLEEGFNHYECVRRRLDGEEFWVDVSVTLVPVRGKLTAHAVWTDISERKEAEARLKESEERYRNIFENAIEGIYEITPEFALLRVNPALARMHGYDSPEEMIEAVGANGADLYAREDDRKLYCDLLREHGLVRGFEAEQYRKDGSSYRASMNARVVRDRHGEILYYEGEVEDITERRRLEDQLRQANKLEAVGTLAGGVAHDFNNRLTVISCFGTLLQAAIDDDSPLRPYVDEIMTASEKAASLTQSLLAFSRKQLMNFGLQNVNEIVASTGKLLKRLLPEDIEVRLKLTEADTTVMVDVAQIDQILMNLATNARDAMAKGGTLTIETSVISQVSELPLGNGAMTPGKYVVLSVSDTGVGMDASTRKRIFDPFFTTKELGKGTGLGLSSVYGVVQQHRGHVTVSTAPSRGTTFRVYLPLMEGEARAMERSDAPSKGGTETLLIAEDDPEVRRLLNYVLQTFGYTTMEAKDGEEAIRAFRDNEDKVDLLLLDVVMPGKNGREVFDEIRKYRPDTRAIFLSGYTGDIIFEKGLRSETVDFVPKPLSTTQLLGKVREVLDRSSVPQK